MTATIKAKPVTGSKDYNFSIKLEDYQGKCRVSWSGQMRAQQARVAIYSGVLPSSPRSSKQDKWLEPTTKPWDTDQLWGAGWTAAIWAEDNMDGGGDYYVVATTTTTVDD